VIVGPVPVDIGAISIEIADIDELTVRRQAFLCTFSSRHRRRVSKIKEASPV